MHEDCIEDSVADNDGFFFVFTNALCEQLIIFYSNIIICMIHNLLMTHSNIFKLCMLVCQWKVHRMIHIRNGEIICMYERSSRVVDNSTIEFQ